MNTCNLLKECLVEQGIVAVHGDEQLSIHLENCSSCSELLAAYVTVSDLLEKLPEHDPADTLLSSVHDKLHATENSQPSVSNWHGQLASALGTLMVVLAVFGLMRQVVLQDELGLPLSESAPARQTFEVHSEQEPVIEAFADDKNVIGNESEVRHLDYRIVNTPSGREGQLTEKSNSETQTESFKRTAGKGQSSEEQFLSSQQPYYERAAKQTPAIIEADEPADQDNQKQGAYDRRQRETLTKREDKIVAPLPESSGMPPPAAVGAIEERERSSMGYSVLLDNINMRRIKPAADDQVGDKADTSRLNSNDLGLRTQIGRDKESFQHSAALQKDRKSKSSPDHPQPVMERITALGEYLRDNSGIDFLSYYQQSQGLTFQAPEGYWSNTYVPGDPQIRLLRARLANWDRSVLGDLWRLEQDVTPVNQPFDTPENNALALTLMGDANAIDGPTRMRLQVGIRGIKHLLGQRPAMNLSVVIDLPEDAEDSVRIATRSLLDALLNSKQPGDQFSLVVSGTAENLNLGPEDFRFGPLQLITQAVLDKETGETRASGSLLTALKNAAQFIQNSATPGQPLGSSAILLISAGNLSEITALENYVHQQAKAGITLSVVPLGKHSANQNVERLVLAGLGNRRYLESPDQARDLIEEELHSASRAVARAARLSIRLAPGVQLVDVIGSKRLDLASSQRIKAIETSMDQRLRTNLGITADRGDDEEGIQIVIPSVFADDSLIILLDVVVDEAGPIADVSLRYKDLVFKKNGTLSGHFELPAGPFDRGPSELAVLKNLAAHHFGLSVSRAAEALGKNQLVSAVAELSLARETLLRLRNEVVDWKNDKEIIRDQQVIEHYLAILVTPEAIPYQLLLADSLRYASWAKAHGQ